MEETPQPAEARADYRFFRFLAVSGSRLTIAGLVFSAWRILVYGDLRKFTSEGPLISETLIFLLNTTALALVLSLVAGIVSYSLFKRRGGKIEKTAPPPGADPRPGH